MADFDHWMRFNVGDYLADTMHLSTFQHGIYIMLIMHYFKRGELPADVSSLARIAKVPVPLWNRDSGPVMALFQVEKGVSRHSRIDAERERSRQLSEKRKSAGKQGASKRWMANANGKSHFDSRARRGARATPEPEPDSDSPRNPPVNGGERGGGHHDPGRRRASRNGFVDLAYEMMEERDVEDPGRDGARVVDFARHLSRG
jgi:uncharacterized protein YdaU (DUF1376 family)